MSSRCLFSVSFLTLINSMFACPLMAKGKKYVYIHLFLFELKRGRRREGRTEMVDGRLDNMKMKWK